MNTFTLKTYDRSTHGRFSVRIVACLVSSAVFFGGLFALAPPVLGQGHGGGGHGGGGHSGGGHGGGGHVGGGHIGGHVGRAGHVGGAHPGTSHSTLSGGHPSGTPHLGGTHAIAPRSTLSHPGASRVITTPSRVVSRPGHFTAASRHATRTHLSGIAHSTIATPSQHFDASRWTGSHPGASHSSTLFGSGRGHSGWTPAVSHSSRLGHSTLGGAGHHFDVSHWTGGHLGDAHHFSSLHHNGHHGVFGHHDFHPLYLGWGWSSYSYYPSSYSSYAYYPPAAYYEVSPDTNAPPLSDAATSSYLLPTTSGTAASAEPRIPDGVVIPPVELPSQEPPEALPPETSPEPPREPTNPQGSKTNEFQRL